MITACLKTAAYLVFQQLANDSIPVSVTYAMIIPDGSLNIIREAKGLTWQTATDKEGICTAFIASADTSEDSATSLYYWELGNPNAVIAVDSITPSLYPGWSVSRNGQPWFSDDASRLYFGTAPRPQRTDEDTLLEEEKPHLDIWSWQDPLLQPQQKKRLNELRKKNYTAVYFMKEKYMVQLADSIVEDVIMMHGGNGPHVLGYERAPYMRQTSWEGIPYRNAWLINATDGSRKQVLEKNGSTVHLSPFGKYLVWYQPADSSWHSFVISTGERLNITKGIKENFYDEENDIPQLPDSYGMAGFSENDEFVILYDRYDAWCVDPSGLTMPFCLSNGYGRKNNLRLRYISLDKDEYFLDLKKPLYLSTLSELTMQRGVAYLFPDGHSSPRLVLQSMEAYTGLQRAGDNQTYIFRKGSFRLYPDIYVTDDRFKVKTRVSECNPQAENYLWGDARLVNWTSYTGENIKGILYTPENIDPSAKYPMLVYFYERNSEQLYTHKIPSPSRSIISIPWCTSNGYVVFVPDITYRIGHPGKSVCDAVISGTRAMAYQFSYIDTTRLGLQGQSWGGYQVAYIVTKTNLFSAAMAGAPVSNMTSAYGGIRWGTGLSRMFQYEHTQSRLGATLWEKPELFIENSPLFFVPEIHTPLLIMHNDADGSVPWYQGIEFFTALRRLDKPAWLLSYNDEDHNLSKWPDRVDLSIRMMQFFDHYLKGQPQPAWMVQGLPAVRKGLDSGYKLIK